MATNIKNAPPAESEKEKKTVAKRESPLDAQLLKLASKGLSGQEIGEEVGLPGAEVMSRIRRILADRDWLTEVEQQKLNIADLRKAKSRIMERVDKSYWDVDDMKEFIRATELMDNMLEKATRINDDQLAVVSGAQARALVVLMTYAWDRAIARLREEFPGVDPTDLIDEFNDGLREGVKVIEASE